MVYVKCHSIYMASTTDVGGWMNGSVAWTAGNAQAARPGRFGVAVARRPRAA
jgi:hypothetical protein